MSDATRRTFLAASPTALAVFGALGVTQAAEPPPTMRMLSEEFERLWAIERHANALGADEELDAASDATSEAVQRILAVPAKTFDELKVKARALAWCYGSADEVLRDFFADSQGTTDTKLVKSILRDLLAA